MPNAYNPAGMTDLEQLTATLATHAARDDASAEWPAASMAALASAGADRWVIPREYGGNGWTPAQILAGYEAVGRGQMAAILILTQRDAACDLIVASPNDELKREWLPLLARGDAFTTVGIAQVTTSHQTGPPAMTAVPSGDGFRLRGFMPWATGADHTDFIVTAAVLPDGMQVLAAVPRDQSGVRVEPPLQLMALSCTRTSRVICDNAHVEKRWILRGPVEKVLAIRSTVKPMVVSSSGLGLAGALVDQISVYQLKNPPELTETIAPLLDRFRDLRKRLYSAATDLESLGVEGPSSELRVEINDMVIRLAVTAQTVAKGTGYVVGHTVERLVREAMFFLVWSAPDKIRVETLARLSATTACS